MTKSNMSRPIIYLPGFNSGPSSEKSRKLQQAFPGLIAAQYDSWNPELGYLQLHAIIQPLLAEKPLLAGSSLGGFWAYQLAKKYELQCLLINPCMNPERSLQSAIGHVENFYSHETGILTAEHLQAYVNYHFAGRTSGTVLHEKGDEVIPYQESLANFSHLPNIKLLLLEGGNHRFSDMGVLISELSLLLQHS